MRIITGSIWNTHSETLFKETGIMKLVDINTFQVACFVYQAIDKQLPTGIDTPIAVNKTIVMTRPTSGSSVVFLNAK